MASRLSEKSNECQASTLLYCLGTDADDILTTTQISDKDSTAKLWEIRPIS